MILLCGISENYKGLAYFSKNKPPDLVGVIRLAVVFTHNTIKLPHGYCDNHHMRTGE